MKVLLELRPALDGHSGIPQETRLLFRGLSGMEGITIVGLIQSSNLIVEEGLPVRRGTPIEGVPEREQIDRMSRVVVSLQQGAASHPIEQWRRRFLRLFRPIGAVLGSMFGSRVSLSAFDPTHFKDFLWRGLFAKSLPDADFNLVTSREFRVMRWPWSSMHAIGVATSQFGRALYARLDTTGIDALLVETPFPGRPTGRTKLVVRYHDAIPLLMPHTIKDRGYHRAAHYRALMQNAADGAWFACVSEATRQDLISVLPEVASRAVTIPNMVSHHFFAEDVDPLRIPEVIWSRRNRSSPSHGGADISSADLDGGKLDYLLMVCTIEPRKNHLLLLDAWEQVRTRGHGRLNLVFVGSLGWEHQAILQRCAPWLQRGGLHLLENVPSGDLRLLYRHARVTVCPSFGEGFDFPGIEAMRCGGIVAASDIPVHRGVFGSACEYFSPYSTDDLVRALESLIGPESAERRSSLVELGSEISAQYLPERILPQWREFLHNIVDA